MSPIPEHPTVVTPEGLSGFVASEPTKTDGNFEVLVSLETGEELWVPADALILQEDGSYLLRIPVRDLMAQLTGATVQSRPAELDQALANRDEPRAAPPSLPIAEEVGDPPTPPAVEVQPSAPNPAPDLADTQPIARQPRPGGTMAESWRASDVRGAAPIPPPLPSEPAAQLEPEPKPEPELHAQLDSDPDTARPELEARPRPESSLGVDGNDEGAVRADGQPPESDLDVADPADATGRGHMPMPDVDARSQPAANPGDGAADAPARPPEAEGHVRLSKVVQTYREDMDEPLLREEVTVHRVPVNEYVDAPPPIRYEGDRVIIPVVEEVLQVEKRLLVKEHVVVTRRRSYAREPRAEARRVEDVVVEPNDARRDA